MNKSIKRLKKLMFIFLFILLLTLGYIFDLHDQWDSFLRAREHSQKLESIIQETRHKINHVEQYQAVLKQTQEKHHQIKKILPDIKNFPIFLNTIKQLGETKGLKFLAINQDTLINKDFYRIGTVQLTLQGNYQQFLDFINALNAKNYYVNINNFTIVRQAPAATTILNNENMPDALIINTTAIFYVF